MPVDRKKVSRMNVTEGRKEIAHAIKGMSVSKSIQELVEIRKLIESDPLKKNELMFHGIQLLQEKVKKNDIPSLIDMLDSLEYPRRGGETRAAYFGIFRTVSAKIKELSGVEGIEKQIPSEEDVTEYIQRIRNWWESHK